MPACLIVEAGYATPSLLPLHHDQQYKLGRNSSCSMQLNDRHASREHALVKWVSGQWILQDLGTTNGTRISNQKIKTVPLEEGCIIAIGEIRLRYLTELPTPNRLMQQPNEGTDFSEALNHHDETALFQPDDLAALLRFTNESLRDEQPQTLIQRALDFVYQQTKADLVAYQSLDAEGTELRMVQPEQTRVDLRISKQLNQQALSSGKTVWLGANQDKGQYDSESLKGVRDAICIPVTSLDPERKPIATLHLYSCEHMFINRQVQFCEALTLHLASSLHTLRDRLALQAENRRLRELSPAVMGNMIGSSAVMNELREKIRKFAVGKFPVLISGETGVGKELAAEALHQHSPRARHPLVRVNCAAIPKDLAESLLFGHVRGAFAGAVANHAGYFAQAEMGTLFLDEIGELPLELQGKLLRVIEYNTFLAVGKSKEEHADVRILAATNRDLATEVKRGKFRHDLLYRFTGQVHLPALREHSTDIPELVAFFLERFRNEYHKNVQIHPQALSRLCLFRWPGNVRQLRSVLEVAVANAGLDGIIRAEDLFLGDGREEGNQEGSGEKNVPMSLNLEEVEKWAITQALKRAGGKKIQAAKILGIHRETLGLKIKQYGLADTSAEG
jgi:transcriptional regulator with GAF, ATPase, and Fis domain